MLGPSGQSLPGTQELVGFLQTKVGYAGKAGLPLIAYSSSSTN